MTYFLLQLIRSHNKKRNVLVTQCLKSWMYRYEGNSFLCITSNATCGNSASLPKSKKNNIGLIIGATVGAILFFIIIILTILCILRWRKNRSDLNEVHTGQYNSIYQDLKGMRFFTNVF